MAAKGRTYLLRGDHDANLLNGFCELIRFYGSVVVKIEVLESFHEDSFLALGSARFLRQLVFKFSLETAQIVRLDFERLTLL